MKKLTDEAIEAKDKRKKLYTLFTDCYVRGHMSQDRLTEEVKTLFELYSQSRDKEVREKVKEDFEKILYWIDESVSEREASDDGVTDHAAAADMLLGMARDICVKNLKEKK